MEVWRAASSRGAVVAVKTPSPDWASHAGAREWLRREHACLARLDHERIVRALDFLEGGGRCFLVMEHLGGGDLVPLAGAPPRHWADSAAGLASALLHVHERGFVHGDVKARNALFRVPSSPAAKLVDFGSALPIGAALPGEHGTPAHRPPSQASPGGPTRAGPEIDVYAFAVLLYELLAGHLPHDRRPGAYEGDAPGAQGAALGLGPPGAGREGPPAVRALWRHVLEALEAPERVGTPTLTNIFDVIEWVRRGS